MPEVKIDLAHCVARKDHNARVALEFVRGTKWSEFLAFTAKGLAKFREPTDEFLRRFDKIIETPLERVSLQLLRDSRSDYLPEDGVTSILLEIYHMTATAGTGDLTTMSLADLTAHYNKLSTATGGTGVKSFKDKATALKRIDSFNVEVTKPTDEQAARKEEAGAKALKRLAAAVTDKPAKKAAAEKPAAKAAVEKPAKKKSAAAEKMAAEKAAKKAAPKKPGAKGQGIGAFCMELILKGKSNEDVLESVRKKFPDASTSASSVAWYRNKLKSEGKL